MVNSVAIHANDRREKSRMRETSKKEKNPPKSTVLYVIRDKTASYGSFEM